MSDEATVVLEKDYLNKPRKPAKSDRAPFAYDGGRADETQARHEAPTTDSAATRPDPLAKPGWFHRG